MHSTCPYCCGRGTAEVLRTGQDTYVRMAVYWTAAVGGVVGLAASGPSKGCRIGPAAPAITLRDVTAVMEASPTAAAAWETELWSR